MNEHDSGHLDRTERSEWASLPQVDPAPELEERTVALLRRRGVLRSSATSPWLRYAGMAAAVGAIFAAGMATGMSFANDARGPEDSATRLQRAGSEYVEALAAVETLEPGTGPAGEVALTTFAGAARELERLTGGDALAGRLTAILEMVHGLEVRPDADGESFSGRLEDVLVDVTGPAAIERLSDRIQIRTHDSTVTVVIHANRDQRD